MALFIRLFILLSIFAATVLSLIASNKIEQMLPGYRPMWAALCGIAFASALYALISRIVKVRSSAEPFLGFQAATGLNGVGLAFIAFNLSVAAFSFNHKINFNGFDFGNLFSQLLFQIRPALIEEVGFRFGIALFASIYFGRTAGIIAGAVPFGLMHLLNFTSGEPIIWSAILGTVVAGAFLTLVFFRHGLLAAILCHYTWNVLAAVTAKSFSFSQGSLEGSRATLAILMIFSLMLWLQLKQFSPATQNPR